MKSIVAVPSHSAAAPDGEPVIDVRLTAVIDWPSAKMPPPRTAEFP